MSLSTRTDNSLCDDLLDNVTKAHHEDDIYEPRRELERIDSLTKTQKKNLGRRQLAQILHQQADLLQLKGDYETALIVYHRAATIYPRDISHNIAVRNTSAAIHSATNPRGTLRELMHKTNKSISLISTLSPETAARQAQQTLHYSKDPYENIKRILQYIDTSDDIHNKIQSKKRNVKEITKLQMMMGQVSGDIAAKLCEMRRYFIAGDWKSTLNIGNELSVHIKVHENNYGYRVAVHRYMALSHLYLGRHDRAVSEVTRMIQAAKKSDDEMLITRSFAVLGIVHLKFAHLNAAARAWQQLSNDVNKPILKAWLHHEIGRCYFEMSNYPKALKMSRRCIESSDIAKSIKWMCYGKLLNGQSLIELGRVAEAMEALKFVAATAKERLDDLAIVNYVQGLIMRVAEVLRRKSESDIEKINVHVNISASQECLNGNSEGSNENASMPWLRKSSEKQNCVDITPRTLSLDNKEQENQSNIICRVKDNSIANKEKSKVKSCSIIEKWKNSFCNEKLLLQSKFDLVKATLDDTITLNGDLTARTRILRPIRHTPQVDKWTRGVVKLEKSCSTRRYIGNDWRKMSQESIAKMTEHQLEQDAKFFSCSSSSSSAISIGRTYGIARRYPHHRNSLPTNSQHVSNDREKLFTSNGFPILSGIPRGNSIS